MSAAMSSAIVSKRIGRSTRECDRAPEIDPDHLAAACERASVSLAHRSMAPKLPCSSSTGRPVPRTS